MGISRLQKQCRAAASACNKARWGKRNEQGGLICKLADGKVRHLTPCPIRFDFLCFCACTDTCPALGCPTPGPSASSCITSFPGGVCVCKRVFCCVLVSMKCGSMLIFLACCGQQIPTLLMAVHHLQVCVCVCCDV